MSVRLMLGRAGAVAVLLAACGDDGDETADPSPGSSTATSADDASGLTLDDPVTLVLLVEDQGESPLSVPTYADGAQLAVDQINEAGGIGGQELRYERVPASVTDPVAAGTALDQALDLEPTAITGLISSATAVPLAPAVAEAGVPFVFLATAPQLYADSEEGGGGDLSYVLRPRNTSLAEEQLTYLIEEYAPSSIALLCVDGPLGTTGCDAVEELAAAQGIEIATRESNPATETNLTAQVQAITSSDAEAVMAFNFPNPLGAFALQMQEAGSDLPITGGASSAIAIRTGAIEGEAAEHLIGIDDCVPALDDRAIATDFVAAFEAEHGYAPDYGAAEAYDAIYLLKAAVEHAGSTEPGVVADALGSITYEGVCDPDYEADEGHGLHNRSYVVTFNAAGTTVAKELVIDG